MLSYYKRLNALWLMERFKLGLLNTEEPLVF